VSQIQFNATLTNPLLCDSFTVERTPGTFGSGGWVPGVSVQVPAYGVVTPSTDKELRQVPEGDRPTEAMTFTTVTELFARETGQQGAADVLVWRTERYRVVSVARYPNFGYYRAIATRWGGQ